LNQKSIFSNGLLFKSTHIRLLLAIIFTMLVFFISLGWGKYSITANEFVGILKKLFAGGSKINTNSSAFSVFYFIRLPRIILAMMVGSALSATGCVFQGMFRNPLVSPDILGVSAGCCFGAALAILCSTGTYLSVSLLAFIFGFIAMGFAYGIGQVASGDKVLMLILGGIAVSAFFNAALSFLKYIADPFKTLPAIVFWVMGGFFRANWHYVYHLSIFIIPGLILLYLLSWKVNILSLGEEEASALGINMNRLRLVLTIIGTFLVAASVSFAGTVCWIGLVIPHIARLLVGPNHRLTIPMSAILGAGFTLLVDDFARNITTCEIPISILTAALGAPFFVYLLIKGRGKVWN